MRLSILSAALFTIGIQAQATQYAFILTGDSTTAVGGGWGTGFCNDLLSGANCVVTAQNGATTQSFFDSGKWTETLTNLRTQLQAGRKTFVTIQFGHNDQKVAPPETMGANLKIMVNDLKNVAKSVGKGSVEPVLVTSLTRRTFSSNGSISDTLGPNYKRFKDARNCARRFEQGIHQVLHSDWICSFTPARFGCGDNTHLNANGSIVFGRMMADLVKAAYPSLALPFTTNSALSYNIAHGIPSY